MSINTIYFGHTKRELKKRIDRLILNASSPMLFSIMNTSDYTRLPVKHSVRALIEKAHRAGYTDLDILGYFKQAVSELVFRRSWYQKPVKRLKTYFPSMNK